MCKCNQCQLLHYKMENRKESSKLTVRVLLLLAVLQLYVSPCSTVFTKEVTHTNTTRGREFNPDVSKSILTASNEADNTKIETGRVQGTSVISKEQDLEGEEHAVLFQSFMKKFNKTYSIGSPEYRRRFIIFKESLQKFELLNAISTNQHQAVYGITKFSDLTSEEFKALYLGRIQPLHHFRDSPSVPSSHHEEELMTSAKSIPSRYDLRSIRPPVVTPVRDQKSCGACWAFSVVETMETQVALKSKRLTQLSVQELVDCGTAAGDSGCHGGVPCKTLSWLNQTKTRVIPESEYPYKAKKEFCRAMTNYTNSAVVSSYSCGEYAENEALVMPAMLYKHGPLSIAVDAESWQYYLGGIIQYHCTPSFLNHAVQIIGYDTSGDIPYYIVRNSWGANWGINGYLHIKIGNNVCGVASSVQTVSV